MSRSVARMPRACILARPEPWQLLAAALASGAGWVAMGAAAVNALIAP
ncbi:hypothetical protein [Paracoccus versutus]|nr:hypothetical protein [Paracoccus versutus]